MPYLARTGKAIQGLDSTVSIDGAIPAALQGKRAGRGAQPCLTNDAIVLTEFIGLDAKQREVWHVESLSLIDGTVTKLNTDGANRLVSGGGIWRAWNDGEGFPLAVDDISGRVALLTDYQAGSGITVDAEVVTTGPVDGLDACYRDGEIGWESGGVFHLWPSGLTSTLSLSGVQYSRGWRVAWSESRKGVFVHRVGDVMGLLVSDDEHDFRPDIRLLDSGLLSVVSSYGQGERPNELRRYTVNPVLGTVNGVARAWVDLSKPADEPRGTVPTFAPYPCRVSVFDQPGSVLPGVFCTLGRDDVAAVAAEAKAAHLPLLAYVDDVSYPPAWVPKIAGVTVIPTIQAYPARIHGVMEPTFERAKVIAATVMTMRAAGYPRVAVVMAAYRQINGDLVSYNWPLQAVLDLQGAVWAICKDAGVTDVLPFVWTRAQGKDGIVSRPEFGESLNRMLAAALPFPKPKPIPAPLPAPPVHEDDMPKTNPTDAIRYEDAIKVLHSKPGRDDYGSGAFDGWRAFAEGTPLAAVAAGQSAPTQTPLPTMEYGIWEATAKALYLARFSAGQDYSYDAGLMDTFRRFGGERWPLEFMIADIERAKLPDRPWPSF